jgi:putative DNA primase/helicase
LKSIIAGDEALTAKKLYNDPFTFTPRAGTAISCNALPSTADTSVAFWRRWIVIPFRRQVSPSNVRPRLAEEILAAERAEIVALAIDHALVAIRNGCQLEISTDSARALDGWREDADTILAYSRAHLDADETAKTPGRQLYQHYRTEAETAGQKPLGETNFRRRLTDLGYKSKRVASGVVWSAQIRSSGRKLFSVVDSPTAAA